MDVCLERFPVIILSFETACTYLKSKQTRKILQIIVIKGKETRGVYIHWTGLLDWNTGLDYWTDIFLVLTHFVVG